MAEHHSLYRKYRPDTFEKIIGQDFIVTTLKNQIKRDKVGHAYLFTGTRGTGKTTTAKIFARAANCLSPVDGSPCGKCAVCVELSKPNNMDIVEIDAASNNGVDEIRELREKVNFKPAIGRKKVYIIDEVHMLTNQAYNALLKTLEEPPEHIIFILATTEVHKIPATILSRCLRFDFRLIPEDLIAKQIEGIFKESGVKYEDSAVRLIAAAGNGSDRDALSFADMCISFSDGTVTYENVLEVLGASDPISVLEIASAVIDGDVGKALEVISSVMSMGKNVGVLGTDIAGVFRNAVYMKTARDGEAKLKLPEAQSKKLKEIASRATVRRLVRALEIFSSLDGELRYSAHPRLILESAVVRAAETVKDEKRISDLEQKLNQIEIGSVQKKNLTKTESEASAGEKKGSAAMTDLKNDFAPDKEVAGGGMPCSSAVMDADFLWKAMVSHVNENQKGFLNVAMERVRPYVENGRLVVDAESTSIVFKKENRLKIEEALFGQRQDMGILFRPLEKTDDNSIITKLISDFGPEIDFKE